MAEHSKDISTLNTLTGTLLDSVEGYRKAATDIAITADTDNLLSATSPMTNARLYAAIGYSSKQAMINAMIADPTTPWAYGLLAAASAGFQFNFNFVMQ